MFTIAYTRDGVQRAECPTCLLTLSANEYGKFTCPNVQRNDKCGQRSFRVRDVQDDHWGLVWWDEWAHYSTWHTDVPHVDAGCCECQKPDGIVDDTCECDCR